MKRILFWILWPLVWIYAPLTIRVRCLLFIDNELVVVKNSFGSGKWQLPGGGVKFGEKPRTAISREINEELGIALDEDRFTALGEVQTFVQTGLTMRYLFFTANVSSEQQIVLGSDVREWSVASKAQDKDLSKEIQVGLRQMTRKV